MTGTAWISEDGRYRYRLTRRFGDGLDLVFVMLNPSTADAEKDDPTIRKCCGFADRMGYGGIVVVNLFGLRTPSPAELFRTPAAERDGPDNETTWQSTIRKADVVLAWGAHARRVPDRTMWVRTYAEQNARKVIVLEYASDGTPRHPLMLPYACVAALASEPHKER